MLSASNPWCEIPVAQAPVLGLIKRRFPPEWPITGAITIGSVMGAKMVIEMDRAPTQPVKDPPHLVGAGSFSLDRLLSHIDPGTAKESEDFVRLIYDQRHTDHSSDCNGKKCAKAQNTIGRSSKG